MELANSSASTIYSVDICIILPLSSALQVPQSLGWMFICSGFPWTWSETRAILGHSSVLASPMSQCCCEDKKGKGDNPVPFPEVPGGRMGKKKSVSIAWYMPFHSFNVYPYVPRYRGSQGSQNSSAFKGFGTENINQKRTKIPDIKLMWGNRIYICVCFACRNCLYSSLYFRFPC